MGYKEYMIIPATADSPINPMGEIPFFMTFLEPKYMDPRTTVMKIAVRFIEKSPRSPMLCCRII